LEIAPAGECEIINLPCHLLEDHPLRLSFYSQAHLEGLCQSIKINGLLEPVLAWAREDGKYQILSGHYRVRAVRRLRQPAIACRICSCDRHAALVIYCTANILTRELSALEEALILHTLLKDEGFTMEGAGRLWGRSKSWVSRRIKLLTALDPPIKKALLKGGLRPRCN
jgi:ParB family chromosome partitioning protein